MHAIANEDEDDIRQVSLAYAATILGAANAIRQKINRPVNFADQEEYEREPAEIEKSLGEILFKPAWEEGQSLDFDSAVLLAIDDTFFPSKA
jgi:hypothetical protein